MIIVLTTVFGDTFMLYRNSNASKVKEKFNAYAKLLKTLPFFEVHEVDAEDKPLLINTSHVYGLVLAEEEAFLDSQAKRNFVKNQKGNVPGGRVPLRYNPDGTPEKN